MIPKAMEERQVKTSTRNWNNFRKRLRLLNSADLKLALFIFA